MIASFMVENSTEICVHLDFSADSVAFAKSL